jgi:hypothetical protein
VTLPTSGREISIATYLRRETRAPKPIDRLPNCWAPNKPAIIVDGTATWAESAIVRALERPGWEARWIKYWIGGRESCIHVGRPSPLAPVAAMVFEAIHHQAVGLRGAGSWDVLAWKAGEFLFFESKQYRGSDSLKASQRAWLEGRPADQAASGRVRP